MLLVGPNGEVVHCNYAAHLELGDAHPLQLVHGELRARHAHDAPPFQAALRNATERGLRKLVTLGQEAQRLGIALVPLTPPSGESVGSALVILGKRKVCEHLSIQAFASANGLTAAETRVLVRLCNGDEPARIAGQLGVAISTVRTQISSLRQKTGAPTIRALLKQIASLPPLMGTLRNIPTQTARATVNASAWTAC
jgi:DNA-binding CsgD family transcriptional regulator